MRTLSIIFLSSYIRKSYRQKCLLFSVLLILTTINYAYSESSAQDVQYIEKYGNSYLPIAYDFLYDECFSYGMPFVTKSRSKYNNQRFVTIGSFRNCDAIGKQDLNHPQRNVYKSVYLVYTDSDLAMFRRKEGPFFKAYNDCKVDEAKTQKKHPIFIVYGMLSYGLDLSKKGDSYWINAVFHNDWHYFVVEHIEFTGKYTGMWDWVLNEGGQIASVVSDVASVVGCSVAMVTASVDQSSCMSMDTIGGSPKEQEAAAKEEQQKTLEVIKGNNR